MSEINPEGFQFGELELPTCPYCKSSDISSDDWKIWCNSCGKVLDDLEA